MSPKMFLATTAAVAASLLALAPPVWADNGGALKIAPSNDAGTTLKGGGSTTPFGAVLPPGAKCQGDSAHKPWYHIFTYLVPKGTDPASVNFNEGVPDKGRFGFYPGSNSYFGAKNTAPNTGVIPDLPNTFEWSRLKVKDVLPGGATSADYEAGVACAPFGGVVSRYWNVEITFTASAADAGGYVWTVHQTSRGGGGNIPLPVVAGVLVVLGGVGYVLLRSSRAGPAAPTSPAVVGQG